LQCVAVCCSVLQCIAVYCRELQCITVCCVWAVCCSACNCIHKRKGVLQCIAVCCSVLQFVAVCCNVLQCVESEQCLAVHANASTRGNLTKWYIQYEACIIWCATTHCNTLQHTATHCNTLQHTATHRTRLHHMIHNPQKSALWRCYTVNWVVSRLLRISTCPMRLRVFCDRVHDGGKTTAAIWVRLFWRIHRLFLQIYRAFL